MFKLRCLAVAAIFLVLCSSFAAAVTIQIRRDTPDNWARYNPILAQGEQGCELSGTPPRCTLLKIGDGVTRWADLPYYSSGTGSTPAPATTSLLKGNGAGGVVTAAPGVDYLAPTGSATGLTNFPTLNQNTTGTAAALAANGANCAAGQSAAGVDAAGNAEGCFTPPSGGGTAASITNIPAGTIAATDVQAALNELDTEKLAKTGDGSQLTGITPGQVGAATAAQGAKADSSQAYFYPAAYGLSTGQTLARDCDVLQAAPTVARIKMSEGQAYPSTTLTGLFLVGDTIAIKNGSALHAATVTSVSGNAVTFTPSMTLAADLKDTRIYHTANVSGTAATMNSTASWKVGDYIYIYGAGVGGGNHSSKVTSVAPGALTLETAAPTAVNNAIVMRDDTTPIDLAIQAAKAAKGGTVQLPQGMFSVRYLNLPSVVTVQGVGFSTIIHKMDFTNGNTIEKETPNTRQVGLRYLAIDGNMAANTQDFLVGTTAPRYASGLTYTGTITSGSTSLSTTGTPDSIKYGDYILVRGAGAAGANLISRVTNVSGTTITLATAASTSVTGQLVTLAAGNGIYLERDNSSYAPTYETQINDYDGLDTIDHVMVYRTAGNGISAIGYGTNVDGAYANTRVLRVSNTDIWLAGAAGIKTFRLTDSLFDGVTIAGCIHEGMKFNSGSNHHLNRVKLFANHRGVRWYGYAEDDLSGALYFNASSNVMATDVEIQGNNGNGLYITDSVHHQGAYHLENNGHTAGTGMTGMVLNNVGYSQLRFNALSINVPTSGYYQARGVAISNVTNSTITGKIVNMQTEPYSLAGTNTGTDFAFNNTVVLNGSDARYGVVPTDKGGTGVADFAFSGNTHEVATISGVKTQGKQVTYDANGNLVASSYDAGATGGGSVSDVAFDDAAWDGATTVAPSKNSIRDAFGATASPTFANTTLTSAAASPTLIMSSTAFDSQTGGGGLVGRHNRVASLPLTGDRLLYFVGGTNDSGTARNGGGMFMKAVAPWSSTSLPTSINFEWAPSGSASRSNIFFLNSMNNIGIGVANSDTADFDSTATKTLHIKSGVAPAASKADVVMLYSNDTGGVAGKAGLYVRTEDGTTHVLGNNVGIGTTSPGAKLDVAGDVKASGYIVSVLDDQTASFTISKDESRITLATGTATVTLPSAPPIGSVRVSVTVAGAAASGVTFAAGSGGSLSWGDAGTPTFTNSKTTDVVCTTQNSSATTTAAWRCVKGGNF